MKKVLIFGTFDVIEERHHELLQAATEHGDIVMVAIGREGNADDDLTENEYRRFAQVMTVDIVDDVILAHGDHIDVVRTHKPDVVLIGPHQKELADVLHENLQSSDKSVIVYVQ